MPRPYASAVIPASVEDVWGVVRDYNNLPSWHPAIAESALDSGAAAEVGAVRRLKLADGAVVVERLLILDDADRRYTYEFVESPFPVRRYISTIRVAPLTDTGQAFVEWWSEFDADAGDEQPMTELFAGGVYGAGLTGLQQHFG